MDKVRSSDMLNVEDNKTLLVHLGQLLTIMHESQLLRLQGVGWLICVVILEPTPTWVGQ